MNRVKVSRLNNVAIFFNLSGIISYDIVLPVCGLSCSYSSRDILLDVLNKDEDNPMSRIFCKNKEVSKYYQPCERCIYSSANVALPIRCAVNPKCWGFGIDCPDYERNLDNEKFLEKFYPYLN